MSGTTPAVEPGTRRRAVSIVLPALNEGDNIGPLVEEITEFFSDQPYDYEVIVVDDGSQDHTAQVAEELAAHDGRISLIKHPQNLGYGRSLMDGFAAAKHEYLFFTDADRQFRISSLAKLLPLMATDAVDILIGYRVRRQDPWIRRMLSWGYNSLVSLVFGLNIKDIDCAFKLFRREVFDVIEVESPCFFFNTEILVKAGMAGFTIMEIGLRHYPRAAGESKIRLRHIPLTLRELWRIYWSVRRNPPARIDDADQG